MAKPFKIAAQKEVRFLREHLSGALAVDGHITINGVGYVVMSEKHKRAPKGDCFVDLMDAGPDATLMVRRGDYMVRRGDGLLQQIATVDLAVDGKRSFYELGWHVGGYVDEVRIRWPSTLTI